MKKIQLFILNCLINQEDMKMKRVLAYYIEAGKEINESLVKKLMDMPVIETWSSLIEESARINKAKTKN